MSEPFLPVPPPGDNEYVDPNPPLCVECSAIVGNLSQDSESEWTGFCGKHGRVPFYYHNALLEGDDDEE